MRNAQSATSGSRGICRYGSRYGAYSAILFDCDGVLVDSEAISRQSWRDWAAIAGVEDAEAVAAVFGKSARDGIAQLVPPTRVDQEVARFLVMELQEGPATTAIGGAARLLQSLPSDRWAVVTSASKELAVVRLRAAGLPLPAVLVTAEDVSEGKPHPECYRAAAIGLGFPPEDCLAVEDTEVGIAAARAAGMDLLGVGCFGATPVAFGPVRSLDPVVISQTPGGHLVVRVDVGKG